MQAGKKTKKKTGSLEDEKGSRRKCREGTQGRWIDVGTDYGASIMTSFSFFVSQVRSTETIITPSLYCAFPLYYVFPFL